MITHTCIVHRSGNSAWAPTEQGGQPRLCTIDGCQVDVEGTHHLSLHPKDREIDPIMLETFMRGGHD